MGLYDTIKINLKCPECGEKINELQTKDLSNSLEVYQTEKISGGNEHIKAIGTCEKCGCWFEGLLRIQTLKISDEFKLTFVQKHD